MKKTIMILFLLSLFMINTNNTKAIGNINFINMQINKKINYKKMKPFSIKSYKNMPGTILVTPDKFKKILPIGHAAIVKDKKYVYEATSKGVIRSKNNWDKTKKKYFGLRVKSLSNSKQKDILKYVEKQVYKKYNFNFFNTKTRSKFYCSHLIWAAYYDKYKINLDTKMFGLAGKQKGAIHPLELVLSSKTKTVIYHEN